MQGVTGLSNNTLGIPGHHELRSSLRFQPGHSQNKLGYNNPAFYAGAGHNTSGRLTKYPNKTSEYIKR